MMILDYLLAAVYVYMKNLRVLNAHRTVTQPTIPAVVGMVRTPLVSTHWEGELASHPDREFVAFRISYNYCLDMGSSLTLSSHKLITVSLKTRSHWILQLDTHS